MIFQNSNRSDRRVPWPEPDAEPDRAEDALDSISSELTVSLRTGETYCPADPDPTEPAPALLRAREKLTGSGSGRGGDTGGVRRAPKAAPLPRRSTSRAKATAAASATEAS